MEERGRPSGSGDARGDGEVRLVVHAAEAGPDARRCVLSSSWLASHPCTELQRSTPISEALGPLPVDDECVWCSNIRMHLPKTQEQRNALRNANEDWSGGRDD